ncbi:MAG: hypothetical protein RMY62_023605 [Nostoc sp. ZfuVER08]|uniref:Uncharacterized protein n=1 Tax=Nostoc punctiforme FACHB-252 TaxID=1357509 RepID=A0ABR8HAP7_NOSPU|nr:hypothetical protein [Nostoc punctiforme]MBD2612336.1 hypothetical protein [Nostoc punctiforme FACHB-252]MBL1203454.1 hypothetical protein [Nostoc sp. GBBB01]MDZ8013141.1 hypothetical protein [Nostoc sp. ZfuVER08]
MPNYSKKHPLFHNQRSLPGKLIFRSVFYFSGILRSHSLFHNRRSLFMSIILRCEILRFLVNKYNYINYI